jgi:hypothetical protein
MACCRKSVDWECCYPDPCSCCSGCTGCVCAYCTQPGSCGGDCGKGACGLCHSNYVGYAWKQSCPCGMCPGCNGVLDFQWNSQCSTYLLANRFDTQNPNSVVVSDFTKAMFTFFAPLSQGVISNMQISNDCCPCC